MGREHLKRMTVGQVMAFLADKPLDMPVAIATGGLAVGRGLDEDSAIGVVTSVDLTVLPVRDYVFGDRDHRFGGEINPRRHPIVSWPIHHFEGRRKLNLIIVADVQR